MLAAEAYRRDLLTEGQLAQMLHMDRVEVRNMVDTLGAEDDHGVHSSRLSEAHRTLVLDASVVINLLVPLSRKRLLRALARPVLLVDIARNEVKRDPSNNKARSTDVGCS